MKIENENLNEPQDPQLNIGAVSGSDDWVNLEYFGETYEIMEGAMFEKGTKSGLPKDIWESTKDDDRMKWWRVI